MIQYRRTNDSSIVVVVENCENGTIFCVDFVAEEDEDSCQ